MHDYKVILVKLDQGRRNDERLEIARRLGAVFGARTVGLFAVSAQPRSTYADVRDLVDAAAARWFNEGAAAAEKAFKDKMRGAGDVEFRMTFEDALDATRLQGRYADLIVVGQQDKKDDDSGLQSSFADELVLSAGKAVLFVPYAGHFETLGERALIAWDGSREAARAVSDALPLLLRAKKVDVATFDPRVGTAVPGGGPGAAIAAFLKSHGVNAGVSVQHGAADNIGDRLLSLAADLSSDLLVMGAYGHSRTRELILGGVTRRMLDSMTLPVLMAH